MSQEMAKKLKFAYALAFGLASFALAFLLILQVCDIYFSGGNSPFTVEAIARHFAPVSIVLYLWIALIVAGFVIWGAFPEKAKLGKNSLTYTFENLKKQLDGRQLGESDHAQRYQKYQWTTNLCKLGCGVCVGICLVFCLAYLGNEANFLGQDANVEVAKAGLYMLPFILSSFALCIGVAFVEKYIVKQQMPHLKQLLAQPKGQVEYKKSFLERCKQKISLFWRSKKSIVGIRLAVATVAIVLLTYGLATGGSAGVLAKAITICRQCIGLG